MLNFVQPTETLFLKLRTNCEKFHLPILYEKEAGKSLLFMFGWILHVFLRTRFFFFSRTLFDLHFVE